MPKTPKNKKPYWSGNLPIDSDFGSEVESTYAPTPSNMVDIDLATENINKQLELEKILTSSDAFKSQDRNDPLAMAASYTNDQIDYLQTYNNDIHSAQQKYNEMPTSQLGFIPPYEYPASGTAEYFPLEAMIGLPGTPALKGAGKVGNFLIDALNPIGGMGKNPVGSFAKPKIPVGQQIDNMWKSLDPSPNLNFGDINYHAPYKPFSGKIESKPFIYEDHYSPHLSVDDGYTVKQIQDHFNYLKYRQDQARNLEYNNLPEEIRETYLDLIRRSQTPEGIRRANEYYRQSLPSSSGAGIIPEYTRHLKDINIKDDYLDSYESARNQISINHNLAPETSSKIMRHELEHALQGKTSRMDLSMNKEVTSLDKDLKDLELIDMAKLTEEELDATSSFYWNDLEDKFGGPRNIIKEFEKDPSIVFADNAGAISYFNTGVERSPFLAEVQQHLLDNKLISHAHAVDEITPELIEKVWKQQNKLGDKATLRILKISKPTEKNFKLLANTLNKMLTTAAVLKAGEGALNTEQEQTPQYKYGGLIPNYNFKYGGIIA